MVKKSVHQVLKERGKQATHQKYDLVYCAGVFDYLSDRVCKRLMNILYDMLEPAGFLVATNVNTSNPNRNGMEFLLDWHLIHRIARNWSTSGLISRPRAAFAKNRNLPGLNLYSRSENP